jgi:hypothetical protein
VHPTPAPQPADSVEIPVRIPLTVYNALAAIGGQEGGVAERAAALLAQVVTFGSPAELYQDVDATARELAALRAQVETVALLLAEADIRPMGAADRPGA